MSEYRRIPESPFFRRPPVTSEWWTTERVVPSEDCNGDTINAVVDLYSRTFGNTREFEIEYYVSTSKSCFELVVGRGNNARPLARVELKLPSIFPLLNTQQMIETLELALETEKPGITSYRLKGRR
jgi:hypothetical protein